MSNSISIHETQCLKKFSDQQALLPPEQRKCAPSRPSLGSSGHVTVEEKNALARQAYEEQVMAACPGCGRTFSGQDRLDIHVKGCDAAKELRKQSGGMRECMVPGGAGGGGGAGDGGGSPGGDTIKAAPKMHMCYICGKEYGSKR